MTDALHPAGNTTVRSGSTPSPFGGARPGEGPLLKRPLNRTTKRIFVAATRMNEGKTTSCLGLFSALRSHTPKVGFIKPIGQRFVEVEGKKIDEDSLLLDAIFNVQVPILAMSPVAIDSQFTRHYLENPEATYPTLVDKLCRGFDRAAYEKDYIIIEGSGHAGVGSVFDLSNAQTAQILGAKVIIVAQGGIGRPVDEIALNKALFEKYGVEVIGAIINKVDPDRIQDIRPFLEAGLRRLGVPLLGMLPLQKQLQAPNLSQVAKTVNGRWLNGKTAGEFQRISKVVIGAMTVKGLMDYLEEDTLIVTPGDREDVIMAAIANCGCTGGLKLSGIVLTRGIEPHPNLLKLLKKTDIPVVLADEESFAIASRIDSMTVKTLPSDTDKIPLIKRLVSDHVNLEKIVQAFGPDTSELPLA